jgi:ribosomal RNA assembly protein
MVEYSYQLKIPKERIAVLIGTNGEIKKQLEEFSKTTIKIDSNEGDVAIVGEDSLGLYTIKEVIYAIGRGFNPQIAQLLLKQDYALEVINMLDYAHNKNDIPRVKGRVIGSEGKARKSIENLTECYISVYGKTIAIIGSVESVPISKRAVEMLLEGSPHSNVYHWLEKKRREMKRFDAVPE